jgi:hypothetical protein
MVDLSEGMVAASVIVFSYRNYNSSSWYGLRLKNRRPAGSIIRHGFYKTWGKRRRYQCWICEDILLRPRDLAIPLGAPTGRSCTNLAGNTLMEASVELQAAGIRPGCCPGSPLLRMSMRFFNRGAMGGGFGV